MMKKYMIMITLGLLAACSTDESPKQFQPDDGQSDQLEAPQLSRSLSAIDASIAAFTKEGVRTHLWKLEKTADQWHWAAGTNTTLVGWDTLVCVVPYIPNLNTTTSYTPSQDATLLWGKLGKEEQHEDGRFYFKSVTHRLAQVFIEVDRYHSSDELRMYLATRGDFHALTGNFGNLYNSSQSITPEKTDSGTYIYKYSIVPQTFPKGEKLFRYKDEYSSYYDYYYYSAEEDLVVPANHRLNIRLKWNEDWEFGNRHYYDVSVSVSGISLNQEELTVDSGHTYQLTATVRPSNATNKTVTWSTDTPEVATVSSSGLVTALAGGTATITATASGYTASCKVTVRAVIGGNLTEGDDMDNEGNVNVGWGDNNNSGNS